MLFRLYNNAMALNSAGRRAQFLFCLIVLLASQRMGFAQDVARPPQSQPMPAGAGSGKIAIVEEPKVQAPERHAFWDKENILLFSGVAILRGLDYASTRNMLARGREEILIPDDVVDNSAGFAGLEAAATMTSVGVSYIFHRTGHHKLERWVSMVHIGATAVGVARNYALKSKHP